MNIAYSFTSGMGHLKYLIPFMSESVSRGHKVTIFCSDDPKYKKELENEGLHGINVVGIDLGENSFPGVFEIVNAGGPLGLTSSGLFEPMMSYYNREENDLPNIIVADFFATAAIDVADSLDVPAIVTFPNPLSMLGLPPPKERKFRDKAVYCLSTYLGEPSLRGLIRYFRNKERKRRKLPKLPEQDVYPCAKQTRHMISTTGLGLEYDIERSELLHFVGPSPPKNPQPISNELNEWIEKQTKPIIYVSFGSFFELDKKAINHLVTELLSVSDKISILWSLPADQQTRIDPSFEIPDSLRFESWVPQWSILAHAKVVAFVTHNGSNSTYESILNCVPMICCPRGADQFANAARVKAAGIGEVVKKGAHGPLGKTIEDVVNDLGRYKDASKKVKELLTNQGGAAKSVDLMEMVASEKKS